VVPMQKAVALTSMKRSMLLDVNSPLTASHWFPDGGETCTDIVCIYRLIVFYLSFLCKDAMRRLDEMLILRKKKGIRTDIRERCAEERSRLKPKHKYVGRYPCEKR
jgi:hypothetical protein